MKSVGCPYVEWQAKGFLKKTLCQKSKGIAQPKQKPANNIDKVDNKTLD
jgi:hypothetical protein